MEGWKEKAKEGDIEQQCKMEKKNMHEITQGRKLYTMQFFLTSLTM